MTLPNVVLLSRNRISPPSASILISPGASKVISVEPLAIKSSVVTPSSFKVILAPEASKTISAGESTVISPEAVANDTAEVPSAILFRETEELVYVFN